MVDFLSDNSADPSVMRYLCPMQELLRDSIERNVVGYCGHKTVDGNCYGMLFRVGDHIFRASTGDRASPREMTYTSEAPVLSPMIQKNIAFVAVKKLLRLLSLRRHVL